MISIFIDSSGSIETTTHFFLLCSNVNTQRPTLFDKTAVTNVDILIASEDIFGNALLLGKPNTENFFKKAILNASIEFILLTERFNNTLF